MRALLPIRDVLVTNKGGVPDQNCNAPCDVAPVAAMAVSCACAYKCVCEREEEEEERRS